MYPDGHASEANAWLPKILKLMGRQVDNTNWLRDPESEATSCLMCKSLNTLQSVWLRHGWVQFDVVGIDLVGLAIVQVETRLSRPKPHCLVIAMPAAEAEATPPQVKMMQQALTGVAFMHRQSVLHRALGPSKILVKCSSDGEPRNLVIAGFGLAIMQVNNAAAVADANQQRWPPEILLGATNFTQSADLWALGCTFAHLSLLKPLWCEDDNEARFRAIIKVLGDPSQDELQYLQAQPHWHSDWLGRHRSSGVVWSSIMQAIGIDVARLLQSLLCFDPNR